MCCFSPDSALLATASGDYTVRVWDVNTLNCLSVLDKHDSRLARDTERDRETNVYLGLCDISVFSSTAVIKIQRYCISSCH